MKTALFDRHVALGAKMGDFAGWEMPLQYKGVLVEHQAVRERAGLFDISHMARVSIRGRDAARFMEWLSSHRLRGDFSATYTCLCNEAGGTVDDVLVYRENETSFFVICNAARREADLAHFRRYKKGFDVDIEESFRTEGILALQGPEADRYLPSLPRMSFERRGNLIVSGTGYTGSGGVEIFGSNELIRALWDELLAKGAMPIGLGARDTLRLEKGFALYGHELSEEISPIESVSSWTISPGKDFLGKESLSRWGRRAFGIRMQEGSIARSGFKVFQEGDEIGEVTSGGFSPTLKIPIALILSRKPLKMGEDVAVKIRERYVAATVSPLPFVE